MYLVTNLVFFTSSTSRIELVNCENINNTLEITTNKNSQITEFTDKNYITKQSIAIEIPNYIIKRTENIKIKVIGDGELVINLKASQGTFITYSKLKAGFQNILTNKIEVSSNNPKIFTVHVKNNQEYFISFNHRLSLQSVNMFYHAY